jgi:hypothetical protein
VGFVVDEVTWEWLLSEYICFRSNFFTLKMEVIRFPEMLLYLRTVRRYISENGSLQNYHCENFKYYIKESCFMKQVFRWMNTPRTSYLLFFLIFVSCIASRFAAICFSLYVSFRFECGTPLCFSLQKYKKECFVEVMIIKWRSIHLLFSRHFLFLRAVFFLHWAL